jgi:cytidyltransferase-like protein
MIIDSRHLKEYRGKVTMVDGCFDPIHRGHIEYFIAARKLGLPVLCNIAPDDYVRGKHIPLLSEEQRATILDSLRDISFVHINKTTTADVLRDLRPKYYVKGVGWKGNLPQKEIDICSESDIQIVYTDTDTGSSSKTLDDHFLNRSKNSSEKELKLFEDAFQNQEAVSNSHYDESYFLDNWRSAGNNYDLETRRTVEGRNPELIKKTFQPKKALDVGCGVGSLMYLLHELGVSCDGIDFSPFSKKAALPEIRDRIMIDSVDSTSLQDNSYDLVICREVLEHLTLAQVKKAVENMCRVSSKYIYVTTRFHPRPESLLSITTDFENDPTHITVLNKNFMRMLFILEGFKHRPLLEKKMDWLGKDRVLVYEK